jgi:hypothetical protein
VTPAIRSVRYIGTFPRASGGGWTMVGQDGGQSIPVGGETLFVFSDTLLAARSARHPDAPVPPGFRDVVKGRGVFLANTAGLAPSASLVEAWAGIRYFQGEDDFPREILRPLERERAQRIRFWPEHGVLVDGRVYLYYLGIQMIDPTSIWGFRTLGTGLAVLDPRSGACERLWFGDDDWRLWRSSGDDAHFGVQTLRDGGHLYVFGSVRAGPFTTARLARVPLAAVDRPEAYEHLVSDGPEPAWAPTSDDAADLGICGGDYSVSFNPYLELYLMVYVESYTKALMLRTAPRPWGPYSEPARVVGLPHEPESELAYLGFEHPDFSGDGGRTIYVSYCQPRFANNALVVVRFA